MTIKEYLKRYDKTPVEFSQMLGNLVGHKAIEHYIYGVRKPRPDVALAIVEKTKGKVTLADIYGHAG
jgi:hypothetical protein